MRAIDRNTIVAVTGLILFLLVPVSPAAARDETGKLIHPDDAAWLEATSVRDVLRRWPKRIDRVLDAVNLERDGLEPVREAVRAGDRVDACRALLDYYEREGRRRWPLDRLGKPSARHVRRARDLLENRVKRGGKTVEIPVENGAWNWNHTGPKDNREFAFSLNRHSSFRTLYLAWKKTGNPAFAKKFDRLVRDWILHTVYPGEDHRYTYTWRVLEAGLRMRSWLPAFHGFAQSEQFTPAGRLLMLSSFILHGRYIEMHHWKRHNHALMELDGLQRLAFGLPELKRAPTWQDYTKNMMVREMSYQTYPDGAHDELSSTYHWVSLSSFEAFSEIRRAAGGTVPKRYRKRLIKMYDYWIGLARPDGTLPMNSRSNLVDVTDRAIAAAKKYDRPEWVYMVTNGERGRRPDGPASRFYPYAGQLVSRSGWNSEALWSFFDAGPAGNGWVHRDSLHLSVTAHGKDFLVDSGKFWYERDRWTEYAHSSRSHNVVRIDGRDQKPVPQKRYSRIPKKHWAVTDPMDFARSSHSAFETLEGDAKHTRTVVFLKGTGWVVLDRINTDRPRTISALWHFHPDRNVRRMETGGVRTADTTGANLTLTPAGSVDWTPSLIRGQKEPHLQGWYNKRGTTWEKSTCARFGARVDRGRTLFAWILLPSPDGRVKAVKNATLDSQRDAAIVRFQPPGGAEVKLRIPLTGGRPEIVN